MSYPPSGDQPVREPFHPTRRRERIEAENRAEIDAWLDERVDDLVARGLTRDEAARIARAEFGDVAGAARYADAEDRGAELRVRLRLWREEVASDTRIALRGLIRTPIVTAVVLLTFAIGVGVTTSVFSLVYAMLLRPLPYGSEQSLVYLPAVDGGVIRPGLGGARHSAIALRALRERTTSFAGVAGITTANGILREGGEAEQLWEAGLTANAFDVLRAQPRIGRGFTAADAAAPEGAGVMILTDDLWRRRFGGDPGVIGRLIDFGNDRREIVGVMPPEFRVPMYEQAEVLTPIEFEAILADAANSQVRFMRLLARLRSGTSQASAQSDVNLVMRSLQAELPRSFRDIDTRVQPIRAAVAGHLRAGLVVLMGAAAFVMLIACANVAGVLLSRAIARRHEIGVRVALGAGRRRLVRQFLTEGAVLAALGAAIGLLVAQVAIAVLRRVAAHVLPEGTTFSLEPTVIAFALAAAIAAAIASSLVPALGATRSIDVALRSDDWRAGASGWSRRARLALVAAQLAVAVVLLVGAGLFLRTLDRLSSLELGYSTEHTLTVRPRFLERKSDAEQDAFYAALYAELRAIPGVVSVGGGNVPTSGQSTVVGLAIEGRAVERARLPDVRYTPASDDYFSTLRIPVIRGRTFTSDDHAAAPWVAVISEGLALQLWPPPADPIGARVKVEPNKPWATIVGVVGDVRMGIAVAPQPSVYTSQRQDHWPGPSWIVLRSAGDPLALASSVRAAVQRVEPSSVLIGLQTLEDVRRSQPGVADRRLQMQLMLTFALVALLVSAIGVYGVCAYATEARRREFGIRMALGASRQRVLWLALRDGAFVALFGVLAGIPVALVLARGLGDLLFATSPHDPLIFGGVVASLTIVVLTASFAPARRVSLLDPATTIMRAD